MNDKFGYGLQIGDNVLFSYSDKIRYAEIGRIVSMDEKKIAVVWGQTELESSYDWYGVMITYSRSVFVKVGTPECSHFLLTSSNLHLRECE